MSQAQGFNSYFGWGKESTYGTPVSAGKWIDFESESMKATRKPMPAKVLGGRSIRRTILSQGTCGGSVRFPVCWTGPEQLLQHAFGQGSVGTVGAGPYTHTFTLKSPLQPGLTVYVDRDSLALGANPLFQYAGCHIAKLKLSYKINEPLMCDIDFIGRSVAGVAVQAPTLPTWDPIQFGMMTIANKDQAGTPVALRLHEFNLEIDNKLEAKYRLTSPFPVGSDIVDQRLITFDAQIEFDDISQPIYNAFRDAGEDDYRFKWMKDSGTDTVNTLQIDIPRAYLDEGEPEVSGNGPILFNIKGQTLATAASDNDELSVVLKNTTVTV